MTRLLLLLALAAVVLLALRRRDERIPARWVEEDAIAPPDPWTVGLLEPRPAGMWVASWPVSAETAEYARPFLEQLTRDGRKSATVVGTRWTFSERRP